MDHIHNLDVQAVAIARRSTVSKPWALGVPQPLTKDDLVLLLSSGPTNMAAPLARISAGHHMLAQLVAEGKTPIEVSQITGYRPERVRTLERDPAFKELVAHYESEIVKAEANVPAQIKHIALAAAQRIQEKLDDPDEEIPLKELQGLMTSSLDRIGHGPSSKTVHQIDDPSNVLANLKEIIQNENRGRILSRNSVEAEYINVTPAPSPGPETSDVGAQGTVAGPAQIEGPSGPGPGVPAESPE